MRISIKIKYPTKLVFLSYIFIALFTSIVQADLNDGLVAHWSFDDCTAKDNSGNGHDGIINGTPSCVNNIKNKALSFDGTQDYIIVNNGNNFPTNAITISYWINRNGNSTNPLENYISKEYAFQSYLRGDIGNKFESGVYTLTPGVWTGITSGNYAAPNTGNIHYVFTFDNTTKIAKTFINGNLVSSVTETNPNGIVRLSNQPLYIGSNAYNVYHIKGIMDEVRIHNRALSEAEVQALYAADGDNTINNSLVSHYPFNGNANDTSINNTKITLDPTIYYSNGLIDQGLASTENNNNSGSQIVINNPFRQEKFTISYWVNAVVDHNKNYGDSGIAVWHATDPNQRSFGMTSSSGNHPAYLKHEYPELVISNTENNTGVGSSLYYASTQLAESQWQHVLLTYENGNINVYINGSAAITNKKTAISPVGRDLQITLRGNDKLDDLRVYNRALTTDEVTALYNTFQNNGLVAHWSFDDCTAKDNSGNGHDGTNNGNPQCVDGTKGKAFSFNGVNDYVLVSDESMAFSPNDLTVSLWINPNATQLDFAGVLDKSHSNNSFVSGWVLQKSPHAESTYYFSYYIPEEVRFINPYGEEQRITSTINKWSHLSITKNANRVVSYLNGVKMQDVVYSSGNVLQNMEPLLIGAVNGMNRYFNGSIDEIRIYNRALTASEITALYTDITATPASEVSSITPLTATLNQPATFTITGTHLPNGLVFNLVDCPNPQETGTGTDTQRSFQCTPSETMGSKSGKITDAKGQVLFTFEVEITTPPNVDLKLNILNSPPRLLPVNKKYTYALKVQNTGKLLATGVTLTTTLPAGAKLVAPTKRCSKVAKSQLVRCDFGELQSMEIKTLPIVIQLPSQESRVAQLFGVLSTQIEDASSSGDNQQEAVTQTYKEGSEWYYQNLRLAQENPVGHKQCAYKPGTPASKTIGKSGLDGKKVLSPKSMPIDYVFVLMLENRSFDSYFGRFPAYLKDVLGKTEQNDPRVRPFVDDLSPDGVDVPGTPYHLLSAEEQLAADTDFSLNASSRQNAPYNPSIAGETPSDASQKHYWMHHTKATQALNGGSGLCVSDTAHDWWAAHLQWNRGRMDGFYQSNHNYWEGGEPNVGKNGGLLDGERAMLYYDDRDIPFYYWLADNFAVGDRYFSSVLGPTWVNRDYLYAATSRGLTSNMSDYFFRLNPAEFGKYGEDQTADPAVKIYKGKPLNYIAEALAANNKKIQYWVNDDNLFDLRLDPPRIGAWTALTAAKDGKRFADFSSSLAKEAAEYTKTGKKRQLHNAIPEVNFIDPKGREDVNGEDEHPPAIPSNGQRFVYQAIEAIINKPEIWKRSVIFITYDEHGGFYDHTTPPPACEPDNLRPKTFGRYGGSNQALKQVCIDNNGDPIEGCANIDDSDVQYGGAFNRYGVRVPVMVVSPWAKRHFVSHQTYDHTSILRFIEARFELPALTRRDANADPMLDFFDFNNIAAKLKGTGAYASWGEESLPNVFPTQFGMVTNASISYPFLPDICKSTGWFEPDPRDSQIGGLGKNVYSIRDWSDGISPPTAYLLDTDEPWIGGVKGVAEANIRR